MKRKLLVIAAVLFAMILPAYASADLTPEFLYGEWKIIIEGWEDQEFGQYTFGVDGEGAIYVNNYSQMEKLPFSWTVKGDYLMIKFNNGRDKSEKVTVKDNDHIMINGDEYTRVATFAKVEPSEPVKEKPVENKPAVKSKSKEPSPAENVEENKRETRPAPALSTASEKKHVAPSKPAVKSETNLYDLLIHPLGLDDDIASCSKLKFENHLKSVCRYKALKDANGGTFLIESNTPIAIGGVKLVIKTVTYDNSTVKVSYSLASNSDDKRASAQKIAKAFSDSGFAKITWPGFDVYQAFSKNGDKFVIELNSTKLTLTTIFKKK